MNTPLRCLALLAVSASVLFSCSPLPKGVWLGEPVMLETDSVVLAPGQYVELLPQVSTDSSQAKVKYNGAEGWVDTRFLFKDVRLAVVQRTTTASYLVDGTNTNIDLFPFEFVIIRSSTPDVTEAIVVRYRQRLNCLINTGDLSDDERDIRLLQDIMMVISDPKRPYTEVEVQSVIGDGRNNGVPLSYNAYSAWKMDLSELPLKDQIRYLTNSNLYMDRRTGAVLTTTENARQLMDRGMIKLLSGDVYADPFEVPFRGMRDSWWLRVASNLPEYVSYPVFADNGDTEMQPLAYLAYRVDRSPQNIKDLWDNNKDFLYGLIPASVWDSQYLGQNVELLLTAYDHLKQDDRLQKLDEITTQLEGKSPSEMVNYYSDYSSEAVLNDIENYSNALDQYAYSVWIHSFWVRRHREGNAQVVYDILNEVRNYYAGVPRMTDVGDLRGDTDDGEEYEAGYDEGDYTGPYIEPLTLPAVGTRVNYTCVYLGRAGGDCAHYYFNCNDIGTADFGHAVFANEIPDADIELWRSLVADGETGFVIEVEVIQGKQCEGIDPATWPEGPIPKILRFTKQ